MRPSGCRAGAGSSKRMVNPPSRMPATHSRCSSGLWVAMIQARICVRARPAPAITRRSSPCTSIFTRSSGPLGELPASLCEGGLPRESSPGCLPGRNGARTQLHLRHHGPRLCAISTAPLATSARLRAASVGEFVRARRAEPAVRSRGALALSPEGRSPFESNRCRRAELSSSTPCHPRGPVPTVYVAPRVATASSLETRILIVASASVPFDEAPRDTRDE